MKPKCAFMWKLRFYKREGDQSQFGTVFDVGTFAGIAALYFIARLFFSLRVSEYDCGRITIGMSCEILLFIFINQYYIWFYYDRYATGGECLPASQPASPVLTTPCNLVENGGKNEYHFWGPFHSIVVLPVAPLVCWEWSTVAAARPPQPSYHRRRAWNA